MSAQRNWLLVILTTGCGNGVTQYSTPKEYRISFNASGEGADRLRELQEKVAREGADSVSIETGLSPEEAQEAADALTKAIADAETVASQSSPATNSGTGSSGSGTSPGSGSGSGASPGTAAGTGAGSGSSPSSGTNTGSQSSAFLIKPPASLGQVAGNLGKLKTACAEALKVNASKVIGPIASGSVSSDEVLLVVADKSGAINIPLEGEVIRGLCIMAAQGSKVQIQGNNTRVEGVLVYQVGALNSVTLSFAGNGRV